MGAYFWANYQNALEGQWACLKQRFFAYLQECPEEWKMIKENDPVDCMAYVARRFQAITYLRLTSLESYTGWIKAGSYYHLKVAEKGQLDQCKHLAGADPPRGPLLPPQSMEQPSSAPQEPPPSAPQEPPQSIPWDLPQSAPQDLPPRPTPRG